jgi:hypothetical protein
LTGDPPPAAAWTSVAPLATTLTALSVPADCTVRATMPRSVPTAVTFRTASVSPSSSPTSPVDAAPEAQQTLSRMVELVEKEHAVVLEPVAWERTRSARTCPKPSGLMSGSRSLCSRCRSEILVPSPVSSSAATPPSQITGRPAPVLCPSIVSASPPSLRLVLRRDACEP